MGVAYAWLFFRCGSRSLVQEEGPQRPVYEWMEEDEDEDLSGGDGESGSESETKRLRD